MLLGLISKESNMVISKKNWNRSLVDIMILLIYIYTENMEILTLKYICTLIFIVVLGKIGKIWGKNTCLNTDK